MKDIKEEAKRQASAKLEKYSCGGSKRADGGKVNKHSDKVEDEKLLHKELKSDAFKHRADGGMIPGGGSSKLGRNRKGGKGKTQVNVMIGKPGGDSPTPPPALGSGPLPSGPSAPMPKPPLPIAAGPAMPPRPGVPGGIPAKRGGKIEHEKKEKGHKESKR